jgi:hypothetical protein
VPGDDAHAFAIGVRCVAQTGTGGCGYEQPLEAMLKALTPSTSATRFFEGTTGHADGPNAGFVRPDSLLAIVHLTDEDDCSAADPGIYDFESTTYTGHVNLRCIEYPEAMHPVDRYVDGLLALRADRPDQLAYALVAGVPTDLIERGLRTDYDGILDDERMQVRLDDADPLRTEPSCNVPGRGLAFPPRRMVEVAAALDGRGGVATVQSICQDRLVGAMGVIAEAIGRNACSRFLD